MSIPPTPPAPPRPGDDQVAALPVGRLAGSGRLARLWSSPGRVVSTLGIAQTLAWASTYYLPAMLAEPMAQSLGCAPSVVFAEFSAALLLSALVGPWAGRHIDRRGGRGLLMATSLMFAASLGLLALAGSIWTLGLGWLLMGVAMGSGLYEAAFASLVRLYGSASRNAITGVTLFAGFASTVGWPLSSLMNAAWGWRGACLGWAALHLLLGLVLNATLPRPRDRTSAPAFATPERATAGPATAQGDEATAEGAAEVPAPLTAAEARRAAWLLAFVFSVTWFVSTAMAAHLPRLLGAVGVSLAVAVGVSALVGPAQVAGRLLEFGLLRRLHPLLSARLAACGHPLGALLLLVLGGPAAAAFALLHGAGNGILTIAKGTLPLVLFGPAGYGARQGLIMMPSRLAQGFAPFVFGLGVERYGAQMLWVSGALGLSAFAALWVLPYRRSAGG